MAKTIFEKMGGTYVRQGDYDLPCLSLPTEKEDKSIGVWGQRHLRYIRQYKRIFCKIGLYQIIRKSFSTFRAFKTYFNFISNIISSSKHHKIILDIFFADYQFQHGHSFRLNSFSCECSLSSILIKIAPFSDSNDFAIYNRFLINDSHLL